MRTLKLLASVSIGAVLAATISAPSHAETFGPTPTILKDAEVHALGNISRGSSATLGSKTYFAASTAASGIELWVTDGTSAGTKMLKDIDPGPNGSKPEWFTVLNGKVYFAATGAVDGREVWRTDGTTAGTIEVLNINPGNAPSNPTEMVTSGGKLYFIATHPDYGREVWVSDGANGPGTQVLESIFGTTGSAPSNLINVDGGVAFSAENLLGERRPFFSAGTAATTRYMDGGASPVVTEPSNFTALGSRIVFRAFRAGYGYELYRSDTHSGDATLIKDLIPGSNSSDPQSLTILGDEILFAAYSPADGRELWTTDGTAGGTQVVRDIFDGPDHGNPDQIVRHGDRAYFVANDGTRGEELWITNGTPSGTKLVQDINPGPASSDIYDLSPTGPSVVFAARHAVSGQEPWVTDGTAAGTRMLADLVPGTGNAYPEFVGTLGSTTVFGAPSAGIPRVMGYTTRASSTRAYPKSSYSRKDGSKKRIRVKVIVRAAGVTPSGVVTLRRSGKVIGTARLSGGQAYVRITTKLKKGRHYVQASYSGSVNAQTSRSATFTVKVR